MEIIPDAKEALEAELADAMNKQSEEHYIEIAELNSKIDDLNSEIDDLNNTIEEKDKMVSWKSWYAIKSWLCYRLMTNFRLYTQNQLVY